MASKVKSIFVCSECGFESPKWLGKCPACGEWNSFFEEKAFTGGGSSSKDKSKPKRVLVPFKKEFIGTVDIKDKVIQLMHLWILE